MFIFLAIALAFSVSSQKVELTPEERKQFIKECDEDLKFEMDAENLNCTCLVDELLKDEETQKAFELLETFDLKYADEMPKRAQEVLRKCTKKKRLSR